MSRQEIQPRPGLSCQRRRIDANEPIHIPQCSSVAIRQHHPRTCQLYRSASQSCSSRPPSIPPHKMLHNASTTTNPTRTTTDLVNTNANQSLNHQPKMEPNNTYPVKASQGSFAGQAGRDVVEEQEQHVSLFALAAAAIAKANGAQTTGALIPEDESVLALARLGGLGGRLWAYKEMHGEGAAFGRASYAASSSPAGGGPQWL